jgi:tetratricopeptide (TPR) repeat protein
MSDLDSSSVWVRTARDIQIKKGDRSSTSQQQIFAMQQQARQASQGEDDQAASSSGSQEKRPAEVQKDKGNAAFKKGDWHAALDCYSAALKLDSQLLPARNNRAMVYLKLGKLEEASRDCDAVVAADASNVKALLRRAVAAEGLGRTDAAIEDLQRVLQLEPENREAREKLQSLGQSQDATMEVAP